MSPWQIKLKAWQQSENGNQNIKLVFAINQSEFWGVLWQVSKMIETYYDEVFEFWVPGVCLTGSSSMCKNRLEPIKNFEIYIFQASPSSVLSGIYYQPWFSQGKKKCLVIHLTLWSFLLVFPLLCEASCFVSWIFIDTEYDHIKVYKCIYVLSILVKRTYRQ